MHEPRRRLVELAVSAAVLTVMLCGCRVIHRRGKSMPPSSACPEPTIDSVSPSTWIAGATYQLTIKGTGFVSRADATKFCRATLLTVNVKAGTVKLSNLKVLNPTTMTATITAADTDPEEPAQVILWWHPPPGYKGVDGPASPPGASK